MTLIAAVKQWFGLDRDPVQMFTCEDCMGRFTKTKDSLDAEDDLRCPTCDSLNVKSIF